jgi:3',5'-cyclic AMP phosphodiesterase CpdA
MSEVLLTFVHISDTHFEPAVRLDHKTAYGSPRMVEFFEKLSALGVDLGAAHRAAVSAEVANQALVDAVNALPFPIDFVLHTGDVMTDAADASQYDAIQSIMQSFRAPVYYLRGNHDHSDGLRMLMPPVKTAKDTLDYVIEYNGVRIVCVDSATNGVDHGGHLSDSQLEWLSAQLAEEPEKPLLAAIHHPPLLLGSDMMDFFGITNGAQVHEAFKSAAPRLQGVFFGHIHQVVDMVRDGVYYSCVQSPISQPVLIPGGLSAQGLHHEPNPGFTLVVVTSEQTYFRRINYPMPVLEMA